MLRLSQNLNVCGDYPNAEIPSPNSRARVLQSLFARAGVNNLPENQCDCSTEIIQMKPNMNEIEKSMISSSLSWVDPASTSTCTMYIFLKCIFLKCIFTKVYSSKVYYPKCIFPKCIFPKVFNCAFY